MVRNNFIFIKNIKYNNMNMLFFDFLENNFIFFKKFNNNFCFNNSLYKTNKLLNLRKININDKCVNILYF